MMRRRTILTGLAGLVGTPALAQPSLEPAGPGLFETGCPTHDVTRHAFVSADGQRRYRVDMAVPKRKAPVGGWRALYLLDGNAAMTTLKPADLAARPDLALVGVGYETEQRFDLVARNYDYLPPLDPQPPPERADRPEGGGDIFLDLLLKRMRPVLERAGRLNTREASIWGHSFGGLCVLNALRRQPDAFRTFISASPSLWWREGTWLAGDFPAPRKPTRLALMVGDREMRRFIPGQPPPDPAAAVALVQALGARLSMTPRLSVSTTVLPGQTHGGALTVSLPHALRLAAEDFR